MIRFLAPLIFLPNLLFAQSLLEDLNGDEIVSVLAFGDSISYGVGDTQAPGVFIDEPFVPDPGFGYLKRLRELAGLATENQSEPGEFFTTDGIKRFPDVIASSRSDIVVFLEGTNDAGIQVSSIEYREDLQKAINIAHTLGKRILLFTLLPPCCNRLERRPITNDYTAKLREVAAWNEVTVVDIEQAWKTTCNSLANCHLYNIPDGLHPNTLGYDVIGQTLLAALYGIDIFKYDGPKKLEEALGLTEGSIVVVPAETSPPEE